MIQIRAGAAACVFCPRPTTKYCPNNNFDCVTGQTGRPHHTVRRTLGQNRAPGAHLPKFKRIASIIKRGMEFHLRDHFITDYFGSEWTELCIWAKQISFRSAHDRLEFYLVLNRVSIRQNK